MILPLLSVVRDLFVELMPEDMLVLEQVNNFAFIDWHAFWVSELHCLQLMSIVVFEIVVLLLRHFCKLRLQSSIHNIVKMLIKTCFTGFRFAAFVLEFMHECAHLILCQTSKVRH